MKLRNLALAAALALAACDHSGDAAKTPATASAPAKTHETVSLRPASTVASPVAKKTDAAPAPTATAEPTPSTQAANVTTSTSVLAAGDSVHEHVGDAPTALNQGNSVAELKITAGIRRAVMFDSSLGFGARNVQIITMGTKVTLRGLVSSETERGAIEAHARAQAGVTAVDDLIAIKN